MENSGTSTIQKENNFLFYLLLVLDVVSAVYSADAAGCCYLCDSTAAVATFCPLSLFILPNSLKKIASY